jgi:hypothetical protein
VANTAFSHAEGFDERAFARWESEGGCTGVMPQRQRLAPTCGDAIMWLRSPERGRIAKQAAGLPRSGERSHNKREGASHMFQKENDLYHPTFAWTGALESIEKRLLGS